MESVIKFLVDAGYSVDFEKTSNWFDSTGDNKCNTYKIEKEKVLYIHYVESKSYYKLSKNIIPTVVRGSIVCGFSEEQFIENLKEVEIS